MQDEKPQKAARPSPPTDQPLHDGALGSVADPLDLATLLPFIVNSTNDLISLVDRQYVYRFVNQAYTRIYRRSPDTILGRTVPEVWGVDRFGGILKARFDQCFAGREVRDQAWVHCGPQGERFMDITYYPCPAPNGAIDLVVVISHDITEQKSATDSLRASEERYRNLVDSSLDLIVEVDGHGRYSYLNPMAETYFSLDSHFLDYVHPDERPVMREVWQQLLAGGMLRNLPSRIIDRKDRLRYLLWSATPRFDDHGKVTGVTAMARDNSSEHRAEALMSEAKLSRREREVFTLTVQGCTNLNIAARLDISEATVKFHLNRIFQKTRVQNRTQLANLILEEE